MSVLRRVDLDRLPEIYQALDRLIARLKAELPVHEVYLFGSFATGKVHEGSDIDLIVVGDFSQRFHERILLVLERNEERLPIEPLCYTPQELQTMVAEKNPFIIQALATVKRY